MKRSTQLSIDDQRWSAVVRRDRSADGQFLYGVKTTGVYCRPSCGARRALRENVSFHANCEEAERSGFRPCKRCKPDESRADSAHVDAVVRACRKIEESLETPNLKALASESGLSPFHFHRVFKRVTGVTPRDFAEARRADRTRSALRDGNNVTEALYNAGFNASGRFYAAAPDMLGMRPSTFRAGGAGEVIRFAVGECSLGSILVAATSRGICAILLGDDPDALVHQLEDSFPSADMVGGDARFDRLVARAVGFVESPRDNLDLPLDIRGTAFQKRVWEAIRRIPAGSTRSYAQIAKEVGRPKGSRAVAGACGANRIALAIPCHRVIRTDGGVSGYRWGVERKRGLLKRENGRTG